MTSYEEAKGCFIPKIEANMQVIYINGEKSVNWPQSLYTEKSSKFSKTCILMN